MIRSPASARDTSGPPPWPWLSAAALLLLAAGATAWSTFLHWLPCRGSMLDGTLLGGDTTTRISEACLRRMDTATPFPYPAEVAERAPWASELGAAAMALSGLAWLVLVLGMRWSVWTKLVGALPTGVSLIMAVSSAAAAANRGRDPDAYPSLWFLLSGEVVAVAALVVVGRRQPELRGRQFGRLAVVAWDSTAFGLLHLAGDYVAMTAFNSYNWDTPPGTGYLTVLVLATAAVVAGVGLPTLSPGRRGSGDRPAHRPRTAAGPPAESPRVS